MKLINGNKYKLTFPNGNSNVYTYIGIVKGNYHCDYCHKERWNLHFFVLGDINNPISTQQYGTECIKYIDIVTVLPSSSQDTGG